MIFQLQRGFVNAVTCPSCSKKTQGYRTARNTICCPWCGKTWEDIELKVDLFPNEKRKAKYDSSEI
jgi:hypothetical protein